MADGPDLAIHQSEAVLATMDDWNQQHHRASGLITRVRESTLTEAAAEEQILTFLTPYCAPQTALLAGNSIHQDRAFIRRYFPGLDAFLHYRQVDVSTVKELVRRWYPLAFAHKPEKRQTHRALDDIQESIAELRYYRQAVFAPTEPLPTSG